MEAQYVPEIDVLIAVAKWLHSNGWQIEKVSMPHGKGIDPIKNKNRLEAELTAIGISMNSIEFSPKGEDIRARQGSTLWKIECKGLGTGKSSTQRNNFDRAVASVMSYFDGPQIRLGVALANDYLWRFNLGKRLPRALREALNLWVLLLENETIYPCEPTEDLPFPGADE